MHKQQRREEGRDTKEDAGDMFLDAPQRRKGVTTARAQFFCARCVGRTRPLRLWARPSRLVACFPCAAWPRSRRGSG